MKLKKSDIWNEAYLISCVSNFSLTFRIRKLVMGDAVMVLSRGETYGASYIMRWAEAHLKPKAHKTGASEKCN